MNYMPYRIRELMTPAINKTTRQNKRQYKPKPLFQELNI